VKSIKVKSLADKYKVPGSSIVEEFKTLGLDGITASGTVPAEDVEKVEAHLSAKFDTPKPKAAPPKKAASTEKPAKPASPAGAKTVPPAEEEDFEEIKAKVVAPKLVQANAQKFEKIRHKPQQQQTGRAAAPPTREKGARPPASVEAPPKNDPATPKEITISSPIIVKNFAEAAGKKPNEVITELIGMGIFASINQAIPDEAVEKLCEKYNLKITVAHKQRNEKTGSAQPAPIEFVDRPEDLLPRPPVVTFLGHVDHGKTSLQDRVRHTNVVEGEAGRITQHIGASQVNFKGQNITFIDTPGHEAFTQMRARGANLTDIAVLVVAADDGFMMQTVEALNHARAAEVPIIVAVNKIDLPAADPGKILLQMQQNNLTSEEWGGDVGVVKVSAKTGEGIDTLLERIQLEAEMLELRANPKRPAEATVLEAQVEHGLGPTANILITNGTLRTGDAITCSEYYGRVKMLFNARGEKIQSAGPSTPVKVIGLSGVPEAGSVFEIKKNEKEARLAAEERAEAKRQEELVQAIPVTMEDMFSKLDSIKTLNLIIKSDVRGTAEAIEESLNKIDSDKIKVSVVMSGVGAITENDIMLASASKAMVVGFHVRVNPGVNELSKKNGVEIRLYTIIYELLEDITDALTGRLQPDKREKELGKARILQIFELSKGPKICGCKVEKGLVKVGCKARVYRDNELIFNGEVASLRRFQDDVKEVKAGFECGIRLDNFADFEENDVIELYEIELTKATL
jgi:translation initiation factor IF-2